MRKTSNVIPFRRKNPCMIQCNFRPELRANDNYYRELEDEFYESIKYCLIEQLLKANNLRLSKKAATEAILENMLRAIVYFRGGYILGGVDVDRKLDGIARLVVKRFNQLKE